MIRPIKYLFSLLAVCMMAVGLPACGDDNEPVAAAVTMAPGAVANIELDYPASIIPGKVMFNATGEWAAEIFPESRASNSHVSWIELSAYKGGAGNQSLQIFVTPNNEQAVRSAVITVSSPTNSITFHVSQKGRPASGGGNQPQPNPGE